MTNGLDNPTRPSYEQDVCEYSKLSSKLYLALRDKQTDRLKVKLLPTSIGRWKNNCVSFFSMQWQTVKTAWHVTLLGGDIKRKKCGDHWENSLSMFRFTIYVIFLNDRLTMYLNFWIENNFFRSLVLNTQNLVCLFFIEKVLTFWIFRGRKLLV